MALSAEDESLEQILSVLRSGDLADFRIRLDSYEFKVHGVMLSTRSKFFRKACVGQFQEASNRIIDLHDDDPRTLGRMILFCYVGQYPASQADMFLQAELQQLLSLTTTEDADTPLTVHATMYGIGDKYDMATLKKESLTKYVSTLRNGKYLTDDFIKSIHVAFSTTPDSDQDLRKRIVCEAQKDGLFLSHNIAFQNALKTIPELAYDMAIKYARSGVTVCKGCKRQNLELLQAT